MSEMLPLQRLLVVSDVTAATQRISFAQPLGAALGTGLMFQNSGLSPVEIKQRLTSAAPDLLILSRLTMIEGSDWLAAARAAEVPVIYHIDDDLLDVPLSLGREKYDNYNAPGRRTALLETIQGSDLVYASTPTLAARLAEHGITAAIVAGQVYCSVDPEDVARPRAPSDVPVMGYMGTAGHAADLAEVLPAIEELLLAVPDLNFELFGGLEIPTQLWRFGDRVRTIAPEGDYAAFLAKMQRLGWWVGLAPLQDTGFNRCKADTKWVEYSLAGVATVAADLPVYHRACAEGAGLLATDHRGWVEAVKALVHDADRRRQQVSAAQAKLATAYTHDALRHQVIDIFSKVLR